MRLSTEFSDSFSFFDFLSLLEPHDGRCFGLYFTFFFPLSPWARGCFQAFRLYTEGISQLNDFPINVINSQSKSGKATLKSFKVKIDMNDWFSFLFFLFKPWEIVEDRIELHNEFPLSRCRLLRLFLSLVQY